MYKKKNTTKFKFYLTTEIHLITTHHRSLSLAQTRAFLWSCCRKKLKCPSVQSGVHIPSHVTD